MTKDRKIFFARIKLCAECRGKYKNKNCHSCLFTKKNIRNKWIEKLESSDYVSLKEVELFEEVAA